MLKTYLYLPDHLDEKITRTARLQRKSKAEIIRSAIEKGLGETKGGGNAGVDVLFKLAEMGKKANLKGPKDSSAKMDEYLWDKDWSEG